MSTPNLLPPDPAPVPSPVAPVEAPRKKLTCEICESQLTPTGDAITLGERAKTYRKHDEAIEKLNDEITRLNAIVVVVTRERDEARASVPKSSVKW